jgi:endonuclease YncB( thermonuclease family)
MQGIDAPESSQLCRGEDSLQYRCGAQAANGLDAFIAQRSVSCLPISLDRYGRTVATCSVAGAHFGQWLVRSGLALDWPQYSKGNYGADQREAEQARRWIWKGSYGSHGCTESAFEPMERQLLARTMRTVIHRAPASAISTASPPTKPRSSAYSGSSTATSAT